MKKLYVLFFIIIVICCLVSCNNSNLTDTINSSVETTVPLVQGIPTYEYAYTVYKQASPSSEDIEGMFLYRPSLAEPDRDFLYVDTDPGSEIDVTKVNFLGTLKGVGHVITRASFPMYPIEYGAYSVYAYQNTINDRGTAHIRHDTQKPIYLHGRNETLFQDLDFDNRDEIVSFATEILGQYASFDGYTLFVYEDKVYSSDGIVVEYNLTIDGQKTNCFVQMGIGYNRLDYMIKLTNDIEEVIRPYSEASVDEDRLNAIVEESVERYYYSESLYNLEKFETNIELMVLNEALVARISIQPTEIYLSEEGMAHYGDRETWEDWPEGERVPAEAMSVLLLVSIASIEYVAE